MQVHQGNVLLYCHEVGFDAQKIKLAVEIVEHFKQKMDEMFHLQNGDEGPMIIEKETLNEIYREYQQYATQKLNMLKLVKEFSEKMQFSIGELKFPALEKFLLKKFASAENIKQLEDDRKCVYCEKIVPKNMNTHLRFCAKKRSHDDMQQQQQQKNAAKEQDRKVEKENEDVLQDEDEDRDEKKQPKSSRKK